MKRLISRPRLSAAAAGVIAVALALAAVAVRRADAQLSEPTATPTPTPVLTPIDPAAPLAVTLSAEPDQIVCDGTQPARVAVRLSRNGVSVYDGTPVYFRTEGRAAFVTPGVATIRDGTVEASAFGEPSPADPYAPFTVIVEAGRLQAGIRVLCVPPGGTPPGGTPPGDCGTPQSPPQSPPCVPPPSPPPCGASLSPPCATPTPPSPPPCSYALTPPAGQQACPTATPTPTPAPQSPPPCSYLQTPPPGVQMCPTPTPRPLPCNPGGVPACSPGNGYYVAIDCDLQTQGLQDACTVPAGTGDLDVGIIAGNVAAPPYTLALFNFEVHDHDTARLNPPPGADLNLNANPDFNEQAVSGPWACSPPTSNNTGVDGPGSAVSFMSCFTVRTPGLPQVTAGSSLLLATLHYDVPAGARPGDVLLSLANVAVGNPEGLESVDCYDTGISGGASNICLPAKVTLAGPAGGPSTGDGTPAPTLTLTPVPTETATPTPTAPPVTPTPARCADVTGDGRVTIADLVAVAQHLSRGRAGAELKYDVDGDGRVGLKDLRAVSLQLGRRC